MSSPDFTLWLADNGLMIHRTDCTPHKRYFCVCIRNITQASWLVNELIVVVPPEYLDNRGYPINGDYLVEAIGVHYGLADMPIYVDAAS